MRSRQFYTIQIGLAAFLWFVILYFRGVKLGWDHLWPFGSVVGLLGGLNVLFDRVLWRWPRWVRRLVQRPVISGTWKVELRSDWRDEQGETLGPIICYMAISQTYSKLEMRLMTRESQSTSIRASLSPGAMDGFLLTMVYRNEPDHHLQKTRSPIHYGAMRAELPKATVDPPAAFSGVYWTDRNTTGTMHFSARQEVVLDSFEDADRSFAPQIPGPDPRATG